jgi:hypothetical protein
MRLCHRPKEGFSASKNYKEMTATVVPRHQQVIRDYSGALSVKETSVVASQVCQSWVVRSAGPWTVTAEQQDLGPMWAAWLKMSLISSNCARDAPQLDLSGHALGLPRRDFVASSRPSQTGAAAALPMQRRRPRS